MYKFIETRAPEYRYNRMKNCQSACKRCKMCSKDTRDYNECWSACDECNQCSADFHNSQQYDEPYEYRPYLGTDNNNYGIVPYAKQYCDNVCGVRMCKQFRKRIDDFNQCQRCQLQAKCWSPYQQRCIDCSTSSAMKPCELKYGCRNPRGSEFANIAPIDPMFTDCKPCWNDDTYTTL